MSPTNQTDGAEHIGPTATKKKNLKETKQIQIRNFRTFRCNCILLLLQSLLMQVFIRRSP